MLSSASNNQQALTAMDKGHLAAIRELEGLLAKYNVELLERLETTLVGMHEKQDFNLLGLEAKINQKIKNLNQLADNAPTEVHPLVIKEAKVYASHLKQACQDFHQYSALHEQLSSKQKSKRKAKKSLDEQALKIELKNKAAVQKIELSLAQSFDAIINITNERFGAANNTNTFGPQLHDLLANSAGKYQEESWGKAAGILTGDFIAAYYPHTQVEGNRDQLVIDAVVEFTKSEENVSNHSTLYHYCDIIGGINDIRATIARITHAINDAKFEKEERDEMLTIQLERLKSLSESLVRKIEILGESKLNSTAAAIKESYQQAVNSLPPNYSSPEKPPLTSPKPERKKSAPLPLFALRQPTAVSKANPDPSTQPRLVVKPKTPTQTLSEPILESLVTINNAPATKKAAHPIPVATSSTPIQAANTAAISADASSTTPALDNAPSQAKPADLAKLFKEKLKTVFAPTQWQYQEQADKTTLTNIAEKNRHFSFVTEQESFQFASSELGRKDMIKAVGTLQEVCSENAVELDFALEAADEQQAVTFLKELKNQGFDINAISLIECKTSLPAGTTAEEFTQTIIAKANSNPPAPA